MADNKRPRRPVAGSRAPSRSPKRLAGQGPRADVRPSDGETEATLAADDAAPPVDNTTADSSGAAGEPDQADQPDQADDLDQRPGVLQRPRTTIVLGAMVGVAVLVLVVLVVLRTQEPDPEAVEGAIWAPVSRAGEFTLPEEGQLPVTVDSIAWAKAVDEIASATSKVLSFNWETIDDHEEIAKDLVTEEFLTDQLRSTIEETAPKLKENKAEYTVTVAAQSVISATPEKVRALLFVNQLVTKGTGKQAESDNYPLRLDVTGVKVGDEWRIAELNAG